MSADGPVLHFSNIDELRLRNECLEWIETDAFLKYFWKIHPTFWKRIFSPGSRKNLPAASPELIADYRKTIRTSPLVFGHLVKRPEPGPKETGAWVKVVISSGNYEDEAMGHAAETIAGILLHGESTRREELLAKELKADGYKFGKRIPLPEEMVGDLEAYVADVWLPNDEFVRSDGALSSILPCFAEPGVDGLTVPIPRLFVERSTVVEMPIPEFPTLG